MFYLFFSEVFSETFSDMTKVLETIYFIGMEIECINSLLLNLLQFINSRVQMSYLYDYLNPLHLHLLQENSRLFTTFFKTISLSILIFIIVLIREPNRVSIWVFIKIIPHIRRLMKLSL